MHRSASLCRMLRLCAAFLSSTTPGQMRLRGRPSRWSCRCTAARWSCDCAIEMVYTHTSAHRKAGGIGESESERLDIYSVFGTVRVGCALSSQAETLSG
eukprot:2695995-Prymnesium_polylepis.1